MTIGEVVKLLDAEILCGEDRLDTEDPHRLRVGHDERRSGIVKDQSVLLTGLLNPQVVRHGGDDGHAVHRVRARQAPRARRHRPRAREGHRAFGVRRSGLFVACGILYTHGLGG